jgi:hypothetical protein
MSSQGHRRHRTGGTTASSLERGKLRSFPQLLGPVQKNYDKALDTPAGQII